MKTSILLNNFSKARFNHYSKEMLDSISNKYIRVLYAIYVIIKDIIPNSLKYIYKVLLAIPLIIIDILDNIFGAIQLWYSFIKLAYYWDKIKENKDI